MSAIHCRNVLSHSYGGTGRVPYISLFMMREFFLVGKWQEMEKDGAAGWASASNILLSPTDLAVNAANPLVVTSAIGGFTSSMVSEMLSLYAANDENRGVYNIRAVIDSNTLVLDARCRGAAWTTETGMTGKIHNGGRGALLTNSSYLVMRAPSASGRPLELHFRSPSTFQVGFQGYVKGDWFNPPGTPPIPGTRISGGEYLVEPGTTADTANRWNAYFADVGDTLYVIVYGWSNAEDRWFTYVAGELESVAAGDNYPGFYRGVDSDPVDEAWKWLTTSSHLTMLNEADTPTTFYCVFEKPYLSADRSYHRTELTLTKTINGDQYKAHQPTVIGNDDVNGGFVRGVAPVTCGNTYLEDWEPFGDFFSVGEAMIPRNGSTDPRVISANTW